MRNRETYADIMSGTPKSRRKKRNTNQTPGSIPEKASEKKPGEMKLPKSEAARGPKIETNAKTDVKTMNLTIA
jgi:hypothetical protein